MTWRGLSKNNSSLTFSQVSWHSHLRLIRFPFRHLLRLAGISKSIEEYNDLSGIQPATFRLASSTDYATAPPPPFPMNPIASFVFVVPRHAEDVISAPRWKELVVYRPQGLLPIASLTFLWLFARYVYISTISSVMPPTHSLLSSPSTNLFNLHNNVFVFHIQGDSRSFPAT
jgi:hypothetical protein